MSMDPDYSPAYQDEYQRLWHEAAARAEAAEAEVAKWRGIADDRLALMLAKEQGYETEVARLRDGLRRYGSHARKCAVMREPHLGREGIGGECSCGYRALLADQERDGAAYTGHKQKGSLTAEQRDELERFADGQPHQVSVAPSLAPAKNLIRRNLLTHSSLMPGFYRITEYGRALLADDGAAHVTTEELRGQVRGGTMRSKSPAPGQDGAAAADPQVLGPPRSFPKSGT